MDEKMAQNQRNSSTSRAVTSTSTLMSTLVVVALLGAVGLAQVPSCHAFQSSASGTSLVPSQSVARDAAQKATLLQSMPSATTALFAVGRSKRDGRDGSNADGADASADRSISNRRRSIRHLFRRKVKTAALGAFTALSLHFGGAGSGPLPALRPPAAIARLPMDAVQDTNLDMKRIGMDRAEKERGARRAAEALAHKTEGDRIEASMGTKARKQFEAEYEASLERARVEKAAKREELLDSLLDQGICPFTDTEGIRQVFLLDEDIDLAHVDGTEAYYDYVETMAGKGDRIQKKYALPRFIVKAQVDDLRAHGKEVVPYFQENQARTAKLFDMPERKLQAICEQYQARIAEYGTLNPVTEEDKQAMAAAAAVSASGKKTAEGAARAGLKRDARSAKTSTMSAARQQKREAKEASRAAQAEARAAARVAKEEARAAKRAERSRLREEKLASIQERKEGKAATKAASAIASHAAADSEIAATAGMDMSATAGQEAVSPSHMDEADAAVAGATGDSAAVQKRQEKKDFPIVPVATVVGVAGGGGYAFKVMRDRKEADEDYRQQQMRMIMGLDANDDDDDDDDDEPEDYVGSMGSDFPSLMDPKKDEIPKSTAGTGASSPSPPSPQIPPPAAPKRRFGGIKSVFSKKPGRESDINKLIDAEGKAPDFCSVVAKSLTYGAPGRFPHLESLPAASSLTEFDLETAQGLLKEEADKAGLSDQDACEEFAKVVNCMIIDIIDLASSTLKEKEDKSTVDAMNIVMDFMDHSAGLFEPFLSEGVSIKPVTYCGTLGKGKLEQLYATYGTAAMTSPEVTDDRVDMFRELFEIKEKRAEGLLQKKMMASLFKMMKDPEAMEEMMGGEGMEEMMKAMGGMEGLAGLPGMDEELTPEQLKESVTMMKNLVESGQVTKEEMIQVKDTFKTAYGMDMEEIIENADSDEVKEQLGDDGEQLIEMFKIILESTKD